MAATRVYELIPANTFGLSKKKSMIKVQVRAQTAFGGFAQGGAGGAGGLGGAGGAGGRATVHAGGGGGPSGYTELLFDTRDDVLNSAGTLLRAYWSNATPAERDRLQRELEARVPLGPKIVLKKRPPEVLDMRIIRVLNEHGYAVTVTELATLVGLVRSDGRPWPEKDGDLFYLLKEFFVTA